MVPAPGPESTPLADEEIAALLSRPPEEFVAARDARVKELRGEGRREQARALKAVRKPLRLAWLVGEVARRDPAAAGRAAGVAADLDEAQASGGRVRPLMRAFRDEVTALSEVAGGLGDGVDTLEVGLALRAVLADPGAREEWVAGRLLAIPGDRAGYSSDPAPSDGGAAATPRRPGRRDREAGDDGSPVDVDAADRSGETPDDGVAGADDEADEPDGDEAREADEADEADDADADEEAGRRRRWRRDEADAARDRALEARDAAVEVRDAAGEEVERLRASLEELETERAALDARIASVRAELDEATSSLEVATAALAEAGEDLDAAESALTLEDET